MQRELTTGTFNLASEYFGRFGAFLTGLNYEQTHGYIADDKIETYAGDYAARLAEKETHNILNNVDKCK